MEKSIVTPSCSTAANASVMKQTSFKKKLVPKLYTSGNSSPAMNSSGVMVPSSARNSTSRQAPPPSNKYRGISCVTRAFVSSKMTLMPPKKQSRRSTFLIWITASIVSSLTLEPPSRTMRMVESFLPKRNFCTSAGSISFGMAGSTTSLSQKVCKTPGIWSMSAFMASSSWVGSPSTVIMLVDASW